MNEHHHGQRLAVRRRIQQLQIQSLPRIVGCRVWQIELGLDRLRHRQRCPLRTETTQATPDETLILCRRDDSIFVRVNLVEQRSREFVLRQLPIAVAIQPPKLLAGFLGAEVRADE